MANRGGVERGGAGNWRVEILQKVGHAVRVKRYFMSDFLTSSTPVLFFSRLVFLYLYAQHPS